MNKNNHNVNKDKLRNIFLQSQIDKNKEINKVVKMIRDIRWTYQREKGMREREERNNEIN